MAVLFLGGGRITGLSSDLKPTTDIPSGSTFEETNTGRLFRFDGTSWVSVTEANVNDVGARNLLQEISDQMKIMNLQLSTMTDNTFNANDIETGD